MSKTIVNLALIQDVEPQLSCERNTLALNNLCVQDQNICCEWRGIVCPSPVSLCLLEHDGLVLAYVGKQTKLTKAFG